MPRHPNGDIDWAIIIGDLMAVQMLALLAWIVWTAFTQ